MDKWKFYLINILHLSEEYTFKNHLINQNWVKRKNKAIYNLTCHWGKKLLRIISLILMISALLQNTVLFLVKSMPSACKLCPFTGIHLRGKKSFPAIQEPYRHVKKMHDIRYLQGKKSSSDNVQIKQWTGKWKDWKVKFAILGYF